MNAICSNGLFSDFCFKQELAYCEIDHMADIVVSMILIILYIINHMQ